MTIIRHPLTALKKQTLAEFADEHGLVLHVRERPPELGLPYYVSFPNVEQVDGGVLISLFGNGRTEQEAMDNYAQQLSGKRLAIDAYKPERRDVEFHWSGGAQ